MRNAFILAIAVAWAATPAFAQDAKTATGSDGKPYIQAPSGMTLYVFDKDRTAGGAPSDSTCFDACASHWPPFTASADAKPASDWSLRPRKDGTQQWAYKGRPLYTYEKDTAPGQQNGNAFNGNTWHVAQP